MSTKKDALGKGIRALLETIDSNPAQGTPEAVATVENSTFFIPISSITANPYQPRNNFDEAELKELADSIIVHGIIQPLTVRKGSAHKKYQLIAGERRLRAAQLAGLTEVPVFVRTADDEQMLEMALIENTHRVDLNPVEIAINYKRLIDEIGLTQEQLGDKVGKDRSTVTNFLRLLKLPPDVQVGLKERKITMGHARAIVSIDDPIKQVYAYKETINKSLSVRQVEQLVREVQDKKRTTPVISKTSKKEETNHTPPELRPWQDKLISHFGCRVELRTSRTGKGGEISIPYLSKGDLERILEIMKLV